MRFAQLLDHCADGGPSARGIIRRFEERVREPVLTILDKPEVQDERLTLRWKENWLRLE